MVYQPTGQTQWIPREPRQVPAPLTEETKVPGRPVDVSLSNVGMTFLDRCEPHPADAASVRPVLSEAQLRDVRAAMVTTMREARRHLDAEAPAAQGQVSRRSRPGDEHDEANSAPGGRNADRLRQAGRRGRRKAASVG
jgi:hypothetical protein